MEGHEEERRGSCKIDTSVHERFRAARAVLRGRNGAVSFLHVGELDYRGTAEKLVNTFQDVERRREAVDLIDAARRGAGASPRNRSRDDRIIPYFALRSRVSRHRRRRVARKKWYRAGKRYHVSANAP